MHGYIKYYDNDCYLDNWLFGLKVMYTWTQHEGTFFLASLFDQKGSSFTSYAFDTYTQKQRFEEIIKIQGIWGKTWYHLALLPEEDVKHALDTMDMRYFQQFPGVGAKTAKRLLVELKQHFSEDDFHKISGDQKLYDDIVTSLKWFWYAVADIKRLIQVQPYPCTRDELPNIMKRLIDHL